MSLIRMAYEAVAPSDAVVETLSNYRQVIAGALVLIVGLVLAALLLPLRHYVESLLKAVEALGYWGPIALTIIHAVAVVLLLPASVLTLAAGFLFGVCMGSIVASIGGVLGALAAFAVGRTLARDLVKRRAYQYQWFKAVEEAAENAGFRIVLLSRLSPLTPFPVMNYLFSVTKVPLRDYTLATWLGMLPGTVVFVYLGTAINRYSDLTSGDVEGGTAQHALFVAGLIATVALTAYLVRISRHAIRQYTVETEAQFPAGKGRREADAPSG